MLIDARRNYLLDEEADIVGEELNKNGIRNCTVVGRCDERGTRLKVALR